MPAEIASAEAPLSPQGAFLVQLRAAPSGASPGTELSGRVEHVQSGRAMRFASLTELLGFIGDTLRHDGPDAVLQTIGGEEQ